MWKLRILPSRFRENYFVTNDELRIEFTKFYLQSESVFFLPHCENLLIPFSITGKPIICNVLLLFFVKERSLTIKLKSDANNFKKMTKFFHHTEWKFKSFLPLKYYVKSILVYHAWLF